ncbi:MAG: hypothetical protein FD123_873 [Bacteroidetes bacterium]|nr:MAG: hypothetical protein FD123_873 [Bacteroidota bacterium]
MSSPAPTTPAKTKAITPVTTSATGTRQPAAEAAVKDPGPVSKKNTAETKSKTAAPPAGSKAVKTGGSSPKSKNAPDIQALPPIKKEETAKKKNKKDDPKEKQKVKGKQPLPAKKTAAPSGVRKVPGKKESGDRGDGGAPFVDAQVPYKMLKFEYAFASGKLAIDHALRKAGIKGSAALERQNINKTAREETGKVTKAYSDTIKEVLAAPGKARMHAMTPLAQTLTGINADKEKQKQLAAAGGLALLMALSKSATILTTASRQGGNQQLDDLQKHGDDLKQKNRFSVFEIASWYKDEEEYGEIIEDLSEMSDEFAEGINEQNGDLKEDVNEDIDDLVESITDDTTETGEKISEGLGEAARSIDEIASGGAGQLPEFIDSVIEELTKQAVEIGQQLMTSMGESVGAISKQAQAAHTALNKQESDILLHMDKAYTTKKNILDDTMRQVEKEVPELPDTLAVDLIEDARNGIRQTLDEDKTNGDNTVKETLAAFAGTSGEFSSQLTANTQKVQADMLALGNDFNKASLTSLSSALEEMRGKINEQMAEAVSKFTAEMTGAIKEAMLKLQNKFADAIVEIAVKVGKGKNAMTDSFNDARKGMEKAAYKIVNDTIWDDIGDFFSGLISGIFEFLASVVLGILAIVVAVIAIVVAVVVLVVAIVVLVKLLVVLVGYAITVLVAMMPILLKGLALFFIIDGAMSLYRGIKLIYEALTTPGLTFGQRMAMIGEGLLEIASVIPIGKVLKVFRLGGRFTKFVAKVATKVTNSRIGKAIVEIAHNSFDIAGTLLNKLGDKAMDMINRLISGKLDQLAGAVWNKLLNGKWTGPILQKAKSQYDKLLSSKIGKSADDIMAVARGEGKEVAERKIKDKLESELAKRMAAEEAKRLAAAETKKRIKKETGRRRRRRREKDKDKDPKKDKPDTSGWKNHTRKIYVSKTESHTLLVEKTGISDYSLKVRSRKKTYAEFVEAMVVEDQAVRSKLRSLARSIDRKMDQYDRTPQNKRVKLGKDIVSLVNQLADETEKGIEHKPDRMPTSIIRWDGVNRQGFGTGVTAHILSTDSVTGEPASEDPDNVFGWNVVRGVTLSSQSTGNTYSAYVKGHLLNENLGGPAKPMNLTPITQKTNKAHLHRVEKHVKKLVNGMSSDSDYERRNKTKESVAYYKVVPNYGQHANERRHITTHFEGLVNNPGSNLSPSEAQKISNAARQVLTVLHFENQYLPTSLHCNWHQLQYDANTKRWSKIVQPKPDSVSIDNDLPNGIDIYTALHTKLKSA